MIYPVSHYRSVSLNYVIHQWVAHFGALPLPSAPVVDDAPDTVADGLGVARFPAQRPVQCQAFDHRVEQHRGLGVENRPMTFCVADIQRSLMSRKDRSRAASV